MDAQGFLQHHLQLSALLTFTHVNEGTLRAEVRPRGLWRRGRADPAVEEEIRAEHVAMRRRKAHVSVASTYTRPDQHLFSTMPITECSKRNETQSNASSNV